MTGISHQSPGSALATAGIDEVFGCPSHITALLQTPTEGLTRPPCQQKLAWLQNIRRDLESTICRLARCSVITPDGRFTRKCSTSSVGALLPDYGPELNLHVFTGGRLPFPLGSVGFSSLPSNRNCYFKGFKKSPVGVLLNVF